jgi:tRNA A58 N-methylase Trm61
MSDNDNRYVEAARQDMERLQGELQQVKQQLADRSDKQSESAVLDTAWSDLSDQWQRLQAAGDTASKEVQDAFDGARERAQRVLDSYRNP